VRRPNLPKVYKDNNLFPLLWILIVSIRHFIWKAITPVLLGGNGSTQVRWKDFNNFTKINLQNGDQNSGEYFEYLPYLSHL